MSERFDQVVLDALQHSTVSSNDLSWSVRGIQKLVVSKFSIEVLVVESRKG